MRFHWPTLFRHRRFLSQVDHAAIVAAIGGAEARTTGEIRVFVTRHCVGDAAETLKVARKKFTVLGMEKTADRNAVLLLVAPVSRTFALVGDTGIHARIGEAAWEEITALVSACFREGDFHGGIVAAVARIGDHLAAHFPAVAGAENRNELPDAVEEDEKDGETLPLVIPPQAVPRSFFPAVILATAGAVAALRLLFPPAELEGAHGFILCRGGVDCAELFHGGWKHWLPSVGLGGYLLQLALLLAAYLFPPRTLALLRPLRWIALLGAVLSLGLIGYQLLVLHGLCLGCVFSALCAIGLAVALLGLPTATPAEVPRSTALTLAACLALAGVAVWNLAPRPLSAKGAAAAIDLSRAPIPIDLADARLLGRRDAPVRLVVFSDFTCDYCARLAPVLAQVMRDYPGDVLLAYQDFPLPDHPLAFAAARAGRCAAAQGLFWPYHDALYREEGPLTELRLFAVAKATGLEMIRFARDYEAAQKGETQVDAALRADYAAARKLGVDGAPSLYLNGILIGGIVEYPDLRRKIDAVLHRSPFDSAAPSWR